MRKTKLLVLLCATVLMLVSLLAIGSAAEEKVLKIDSANVAYNDMMHLVFTLENTDLVPEGAEAGIIVWDKAQDEFLVSNARFATFTQYSDGKTTYYKSYGVAAPQIGTEIYIAACYIADEVITVTQDPVSYSLVDYFVSRLNKNIELYQAELYESVLTYGAASDKVLEDNAFVLVKANGGYVGNYNRACGAAKEVGESFLLRAPVTDGNGAYFSKWVNENGETVSIERVYNVTPDKTGISKFTAVYGTLEESAYANAFGFDEYEIGEVNKGTPDLSKAPTLSAQGAYSGTNYMLWNSDKTIGNIYYYGYFGPTATITGQTDKGKNIYEFTVDENGNYSVDKYDSFHVVEENDGDNVLSVHRDLPSSGWGVRFTNNNASTNKATYAEVDLRYDTFARDNVQHHVSIEVFNGTETVTYRTNLFDSTSQSSYIYAENSANSDYSSRAVRDEEGKVKYFSHDADETFTFGAKFVNRTETVDGVETAVSYVDYYINGEYFGSLPLSMFSTHKAALADGSYYISRLSVVAISSARDDISIDNVCFK